MVNCLYQPPPIDLAATAILAGTPGRRGTGGRYHLTDLCWTIAKGVARQQTTVFLARAKGYYSCPYCATEQPACCRTGDHTKHVYAALPVLPAPERPEWERELELSEEPDGQ